MTNFQQGLMAFVMTNADSGAEESKMREEFKMMDADNNGKLSKQEIKEALKKPGSLFKMTEKDVMKLFDAVDTDASGFIDYREFIIAANKHKKVLSINNLKAAFKLIDTVIKSSLFS
jgi:calcium-dependent protein kinase